MHPDAAPSRPAVNSFLRASIVAIALGAFAILAAFASAWVPGGAPIWGVWCMVIGSALLMAGTLTLGAVRSGVGRRLALTLGGFLVVLITAGFGLPIVLAHAGANPALVLGLPLPVAIEVFGVGLLPALVLPVVYAATFRRDGLDQPALDEFRKRADEARRTSTDSTIT
ncbi:MAG: hypothetical protein ACREK8_00890 [Gemmatimonadales bacterium]